MEQLFQTGSRCHSRQTDAVDDPAANDHCLPVAERFAFAWQRGFENLDDLGAVVSFTSGHSDAPDPGDSFVLLGRVDLGLGSHRGENFRRQRRMLLDEGHSLRLGLRVVRQLSTDCDRVGVCCVDRR